MSVNPPIPIYPSILMIASTNAPPADYPVAFTAWVNSTSGGAVPTGVVSFYDGFGNLGTWGTFIGQVTLQNGEAVFTTSALAQGTHSITAIYGGDGNYKPVQSETRMVFVGPPWFATTTILTASTAAPQAGQQVTFTATVKGAGGSGVPSGTVTFMDGTTVLGTVSLDGNGQASLTTTLGAGTHSILAHYSGGPDSAGDEFFVSDSWALTLTVGQGQATTTTLAASAGTAQARQKLTFTATVSAGTAQLGALPGTVTFMDGTTVLGTASLDANGRASFSTAALGAGTHSITASYSGGAGYQGSESEAVTVSVSQPAPTPVPLPAHLVDVARALTHSAEHYRQFITAAYQTYLGRTPDAPGLASWLWAMQNGLSDEQLEAGFIGSTEYIANHGGQGAGWVIGMYQDLLGRTPAQSEVDGWVYALSHGLSPQQVAYGFAASNEREGIRVKDDYMSYLGRTPSQAEVNGWVFAFTHGVSNEDVVAGFVGSKESFDRAGDDIPTWVENAYQSILGRQADPAGLDNWTAFLERG
jgi:hypothetical protein